MRVVYAEESPALCLVDQTEGVVVKPRRPGLLEEAVNGGGPGLNGVKLDGVKSALSHLRGEMHHLHLARIPTPPPCCGG